MPPKDIRDFFGGKTSTPIREKENLQAEDPKKKRSSKIQHFTWLAQFNGL
jgi:hypothetical protein